MTAGQYKAGRDPRGYTPTTEDVRDEWRYNIQEVDIDGYVVVSFDEAGAQFDRWLAEHDAALIEGLAEEIRSMGVHLWGREDLSVWLREKARQRREEQDLG